MCSPHLEMKFYDVGKLYCFGLMLPMIGNMSLPCLSIKTSKYLDKHMCIYICVKYFNRELVDVATQFFL